MEVVGSFYCTFCFAITLSMLWRARFPCEFILLGRILELFRRKGYIVTHELVWCAMRWEMSLKLLHYFSSRSAMQAIYLKVVWVAIYCWLWKCRQLWFARDGLGFRVEWGVLWHSCFGMCCRLHTLIWSQSDLCSCQANRLLLWLSWGNSVFPCVQHADVYFSRIFGRSDSGMMARWPLKITSSWVASSSLTEK